MSLLATVTQEIRTRLDLIPDEHPGATADWSPTSELAAIDRAEPTAVVARVPAWRVAIAAQRFHDAAARTRRWLRIDTTSKES